MLKLGKLDVKLSEERNPMQTLREGGYDIHPNNVVIDDVKVEPNSAEYQIATFLEAEGVTPVLLQQYLKDLNRYNMSKMQSVTRIAHSEEDRKSRKFDHLE